VGGDDTVFMIDGSFTSGENIQFIGGSAVISENSVLSNNPANWGQYLINGANVTNYGSMSLELEGVNGSAMNITNGGSLTLSGEKASLSINMKDGGVSNKDINVTNGTLAVKDNASLTTTGAVTVAAAGTLELENGIVDLAAVTNAGTVNVTGGSVDLGAFVNTGAVNVAGGIFQADEVSGTGTFAVGAGTTELQIGNLKQNIKVNENSDEAVVLTGNVNGSGVISVYGDAALNDFNVNGDYIGQVVSGQGQVKVYNKTVISDSKMNLNYFQSFDDVTLAADAVISTANINIYDKVADADFIVEGTLNACTLIVLNNYYNADSGSELVIAKDGVLNGVSQNGNGRFDIQGGNMTVYGYVNSQWTAGGGKAYIGMYDIASTLTIDGTYAAVDNNNGKFINNGNQTLSIGEDADIFIQNGAEFAWNAAVTNNGTFTVCGDTASTLNIADFSGNAIEVISAGLKDSLFGGNIRVSGDAEFSGYNEFTGHIKVTNGAELVIAENSSVVGGSETCYHIGNDDESFSQGMANGDTVGGKLTVDGVVELYALSANSGAEIVVNGDVFTEKLNAGNGGLTDGKAGVIEVAQGGSVDTQNLYIWNQATVTVNGELSGTEIAVNDGELNIDGGYLDAGNASVAANGTVNVTGESIIQIDSLTGAIQLDNAELTASSINKGTVNFKGDNTFAGDFNAAYAHVGDWTNDSYSGSIDFGTETDVNVGGQMDRRGYCDGAEDCRHSDGDG
jgi:hypothetical protein